MNTKIYIILSIYFSAVFARLPPNLRGKKCPRRGPGVETCILKSIESLRPKLKTGIREINIPRLEPFRLREIDLDAEVPNMLLKGEATNIVAKGASDLVVKNLKVNLDTYEFDATIMIPHLSVTADYDTVGSRIANFDVDGSGQFKGEFTDIVATLKANGHAKKVKKLEYMKIDDFTININIGKTPKVHIEPDEKTNTAQITSRFVENNIGTLLNNMHEVINKAAKPLILSHLNRVLNVVPIDDLFK